MIGLSRNLSHHRQCKRKIVRALLVPQNRQPNILRPLPTMGCFQAKAAAKMGSEDDWSSDDWEKCWKEGSTRWDLGEPTPVVIQLVQSGSLPMGRVLVPGCGSGYDVVAMAGHERYVVGLDKSTTAIEKAKDMHSQSSQCFICLKVKSQCIKWLSSSLPNANQFTFVTADFFTWQPTEKFDLIFDYLFFCAIHPRSRPDWAKRVQELLKPDGELITLIYLNSDQEAGAPYNTTISDYEKVLNPLGFKAISVEDNEVAVESRKGREKLARWKRTTP